MSSKLPPSKYDPFMEMRSPDFEVQYVLDENAPEVALHAHIFYEVYLFCSGDIESYVVDNNSYPIKSGDILLIPPEVMHHPIFSGSGGGYKRYVLYISQSFFERLQLVDPELGNIFERCRSTRNYLIRCKKPAQPRILEDRLLDIWNAHHSGKLCSKATETSRCIDFLVELNRANTERLSTDSGRDNRSLLEQILTYISENYQHPLSLGEVAAQFFVSPSTVENLFKQRLGKSFYRYVIEYRIISAQALILKGTSLKDVSSLCGFGDYSTFFKMFRKEVGVSPSRFKDLAVSTMEEQAKPPSQSN